MYSNCFRRKYCLNLNGNTLLGFTSAEKDTVKCIKSEAPQATTAIFFEDTKGNLKIKNHKKDEERPSEESGYISSHAGDSGCPYWTTDRIKEKLDKGKEEDAEGVDLERATLVAIHTSGYGIGSYSRGSYLNNRGYECRAKAVKMTDDILRWAKKKGGIKVKVEK